jgi:hypothetical protein
MDTSKRIYWEISKSWFKREKLFFDSYDAEALENIVSDTTQSSRTHGKVKDSLKYIKSWLLLDDFADDPIFSRHSKFVTCFIHKRKT